MKLSLYSAGIRVRVAGCGKGISIVVNERTIVTLTSEVLDRHKPEWISGADNTRTPLNHAINKAGDGTETTPLYRTSAGACVRVAVNNFQASSYVRACNSRGHSCWGRRTDSRNGIWRQSLGSYPIRLVCQGNKINLRVAHNSLTSKFTITYLLVIRY